jgi:hypothetical protein
MHAFPNRRVGRKDLKSVAVELLTSGRREDSGGTEKRVELDSFPGEYIVDVGYMSNPRYMSWTILLTYDNTSETAENERRREDTHCD